MVVVVGWFGVVWCVWELRLISWVVVGTLLMVVLLGWESGCRRVFGVVVVSFLLHTCRYVGRWSCDSGRRLLTAHSMTVITTEVRILCC